LILCLYGGLHSLLCCNPIFNPLFFKKKPTNKKIKKTPKKHVFDVFASVLASFPKNLNFLKKKLLSTRSFVNALFELTLMLPLF
jgi:hypothetical protein